MMKRAGRAQFQHAQTNGGRTTKLIAVKLLNLDMRGTEIYSDPASKTTAHTKRK